jgi:hypothetical protein
MSELIKVWRKNGFTLRMYDTYKRDWRGQTRVAYTLKDRRKLIFEGTDFSGSPLHCDDSLESVASLLGFLTLRPGDTYREYFDKYTPEQLAWCESSRCQELGMIQYYLEERLNNKRRR